MLGYPGAGKTTAAEIISKLTSAVHLCSDRFRLSMFPKPKFTPEEHASVYGALDYLTELLLQKGVSVIYDANLNRFTHRQDKYNICNKTGAKPVLLWVHTSQDLAEKRATEEGDNNIRRPYGNLEKHVFKRLVKEIEPPRAQEFTIKVDGTKITADYMKRTLSL
jgi:predicted kinase